MAKAISKRILAKIAKPEANKEYIESISNQDYEDLIPPSIQQNDLRMDESNMIDMPDEFEKEDQVISVTDEDGGLSIEVNEGPNALARSLNPDFYDNLVLDLSDDMQDELSESIRSYYDEDRESRSKRDEQQNKGLREMGLDPTASNSGANFEGASVVIHPMLSQAVVEFSSRAGKELVPPSGPVKSEINGSASTRKVDEASRKVSFLNKLLMEFMPYRNVNQQMLSQLPIGGTQFIKFWHDNYLKRPTCEFLPVDMVYIPYQCNDFYAAERVTVQYDINQIEYHRRLKDGLYYDPEYLEDDFDFDVMPDNKSGGSNPDEHETKSERTRAVIEGKSTVDGDSNAVTVLECYTYLNLPEDPLTDGEYAPYIVTVKLDSEEVISIYRNWDINDKKKHKLDYIVKYDFIPSAGAYATSLSQLVGSLTVAGTGALRALLDSAHVNNLPTALALKGLKMAGQSPDIAVGSLTYLEGPSGTSDPDIKKMMMPLPFNPPSATLFQLLEWLTTIGSQVVKTPDGATEGMGDRTPANTTLARIEQSSAVQSAIMTNLHFSQKKALEVIGRLVRDHFDADGYPDWLLNDYKINAALFEHTRDIVPVSDPNIFTEVQRYAQLEAVMQLASSAAPGTFNMIEIYRRSLQMIKVPNPEMLLNIPQATTKSNAIAENMAAFLGQPIHVYPDQDHVAHITSHLAFLQDPLFGANPLFNSQMTVMLDHLKQHLIYYYAQTYQQAMKNEAGVDEFDIKDSKNVVFDQKLSELSPSVSQHIMQTLQPLLEGGQKSLQNLQQMIQQQSQQNQNPEQIKLQIEQAKLQAAQANAQQSQQLTQIKTQEVQQKGQLEQAKLQQMMQIEQMKDKTETNRLLNEHEISQIQAQADKEQNQADLVIEKLRLQQTREDNAAALQVEREHNIAELQIQALESGHKMGNEMIRHHIDSNNDIEKHNRSLENAAKIAKSKAGHIVTNK